MQTFHWQVRPAGTPLLHRSCPRCGPSLYVCSNQFRINANGSRLDVWLIYRCQSCGKSYNLTVYERVHPGFLASTGRYARLLANDAALAAELGSDASLLRKNRAQAIDNGFVVEVPPLPPGTSHVVIHSPAGLSPRLDKVLASALGLSRSQVAGLLQNGAVRVPSAEKRPGKTLVRGTLQIEIDNVMER